MVAAIKYMQERVSNEGTIQAELLKETVEAEGLQAVDTLIDFVTAMLPYGFPYTLSTFDDATETLTNLGTFSQLDSWGGTCDDTRIWSQCTAQMKEWDICNCIRTGEDLIWAIIFAMSPNWYLDPATQTWSILPKDPFKPGCRSRGNEAPHSVLLCVQCFYVVCWFGVLFCVLICVFICALFCIFICVNIRVFICALICVFVCVLICVLSL